MILFQGKEVKVNKWMLEDSIVQVELPQPDFCLAMAADITELEGDKELIFVLGTLPRKPKSRYKKS